LLRSGVPSARGNISHRRGRVGKSAPQPYPQSPQPPPPLVSPLALAPPLSRPSLHGGSIVVPLAPPLSCSGPLASASCSSSLDPRLRRRPLAECVARWVRRGGAGGPLPAPSAAALRAAGRLEWRCGVEAGRLARACARSEKGKEASAASTRSGEKIGSWDRGREPSRSGWCAVPMCVFGARQIGMEVAGWRGPSAAVAWGWRREELFKWRGWCCSDRTSRCRQGQHLSIFLSICSRPLF
jgi:hypothetical protein